MDFWKAGGSWGTNENQPVYNYLFYKWNLVVCDGINMHKDDLVAICEGKTASGIALLTSDSFSCTEKPELKDDFTEYWIPFKKDVKIAYAIVYRLEKDEYFSTGIRQGITRISGNNEARKIMEGFMPKLMEQKDKNNIITLLKTKKNIILHGAPGTGKTYTARQIASELKCQENQTKLVQFHPSYDYTDFVEGLRPIEKDNDQVGFRRMDGVFKAFCEEAIKALGNAKSTEDAPKYVFIIDEINRGDISKIFGELFYCIDNGYRVEKEELTDTSKKSVQTQYQNLVKDSVFEKGFFIPANVYIIGTMNDIDRSVESMDFAMRRRFAFYEITAESSAGSMGIDYSDNSPMKRLNDIIAEKLGSKDYQIGGSYFMPYKDRLSDKGSLDELWDTSLEILLKEYLRGKKNSNDILLEMKNSFYGNN